MAHEENQEEHMHGASAKSLVGGLMPTPPPVKHVSPPSIEPDLDFEHDEDVPLAFCRIDNVLGLAEVPGLAERVLLDELHTVSAEEPASLEEAVRDRSWLTVKVHLGPRMGFGGLITNN
jgi:hypothetical protein